MAAAFKHGDKSSRRGICVNWKANGLMKELFLNVINKYKRLYQSNDLPISQNLMKYHLFDWESLRFEKYCHILNENHRSAVFDGKGNE